MKFVYLTYIILIRNLLFVFSLILLCVVHLYSLLLVRLLVARRTIRLIMELAWDNLFFLHFLLTFSISVALIWFLMHHFGLFLNFIECYEVLLGSHQFLFFRFYVIHLHLLVFLIDFCLQLIDWFKRIWLFVRIISF